MQECSRSARRVACTGGHCEDESRLRLRRRTRQTHAAAVLVAVAAQTRLPTTAASPIAPRTSAVVPAPAAPSSSCSTADDQQRASNPSAAAPTAANFSPASPPVRQGAPATTQTPRARKRAPVPPRYVNSDGQWVEDYGWTLRGKGTMDPAAATASTAHATAMEDHVPTSVLTSQQGASATGTALEPEQTPNVAGLGVDAGALPSASASSSTASTSSATSSAEASATSLSISIPYGWQAVPRETNYYAVPLVIAMSVLVAVLVAISIFISVIVRRKKRRRRKAAAARKARRLAAANGTAKEVPGDVGDLDARGEKGWRGTLDKFTGGQGRRKRKRAKRAASRGVIARGDPTDGEEEGGTGRIPTVRRRVRVTGFSAAGVRNSLRRRSRRGDQDGDDDADGRSGGDDAEDERALSRSGTRSSAASVVEDTLTHRIATRLSSASSRAAALGARGAGTTTVFSRDARNGSVVSLTASALDRVGSRSSRRSAGAATSSSASIRSTSSALLGPAVAAPPEILFTPADDPTLPDHLAIPGSPHPRPNSPRSSTSSSLPPPTVAPLPPPATTAPPPVSSFGAMIATDSLPAPGPPAYRPSSSTVQRTRRFADADHATVVGDAASRLGATRRRLRRLRRESEGTSTERGMRSDENENDEGEWHWPGEKGRPFASSSTSADPFAEAEAGDLPGALLGSTSEEHGDSQQEQSEDPVPPPVDRSLFSAHIATDDKAVLARLRQQRERSPFVLDDEEADVGVSSAGSSVSHGLGTLATSMPAPSAPPVVADEADLDEDGFERYDFSTPTTMVTASPGSSSSAIGEAAAATSSMGPSLLPAPPQRVTQVSLLDAIHSPNGTDRSSASSTVPLLPGGADGPRSTSSYFPPTASQSASTSASSGKAREARAESEVPNGDGGDEEDLPMYLPGSTGAAEALRMASAPVDDEGTEDEGDDDSGVEWDEGDHATTVALGQDERQEEGIV
ncbi:hypothetical protein JCM3774_006646 [Rhodotorula dairenensis]